MTAPGPAADPGALRVTVVGSADAFNAAGRGHSCYLLEADGARPVMVDFGATALFGLRRVGWRPNDVAAFVFTHLHGDHIGGFPYLVIDALFNDPRPEPLRVVGPVGTEARLMALLEATYGDAILDGRDLTLQFVEIPAGSTHGVVGFGVETFRADHMEPPDEPLCLRFTTPAGATVAFSGDTELGEGLRAAIAGVDLGVVECSGLAPPCGRHCTWEDWQAALPELDAQRLLLTHLGAAVRAAAPRLLLARPSGGPRIDFAEDGMIVDVPPLTARRPERARPPSRDRRPCSPGEEGAVPGDR